MSQLVQASNMSRKLPWGFTVLFGPEKLAKVNEVIMESADGPYQCSIYLRLQWLKAKLIHKG